MTELFKSVTGTQMTHIPYRGSGPAMVDLISGNTQAMFETMPSALQHVRAGSVRAIAVTGLQRTSYLPELPTIAEAGVGGYDATSWYGLFAPARTPAPVVERLNQAINAAFQNPRFIDSWTRLGADPGGGTPQELARLTAAEVDRWAAVARQSHISV
jgi:tripartite-type tricarboxylate transporter receptor subunit TctC